MITELQKALLAAAAKRKPDEAGSIAHIFYVAIQVGDEDTVEYISKHYATAEHFNAEELERIAEVEAEIAAEEAAGATFH